MAANLDTSASGVDKIAPEHGLWMMEQCITCAQHSNVVVAPLRAFAKQLGVSLPSLLFIVISYGISMYADHIRYIQ